MEDLSQIENKSSLTNVPSDNSTILPEAIGIDTGNTSKIKIPISNSEDQNDNCTTNLGKSTEELTVSAQSVKEVTVCLAEHVPETVAAGSETIKTDVSTDSTEECSSSSGAESNEKTLASSTDIRPGSLENRLTEQEVKSVTVLSENDSIEMSSVSTKVEPTDDATLCEETAQMTADLCSLETDSKNEDAMSSEVALVKQGAVVTEVDADSSTLCTDVVLGNEDIKSTNILIKEQTTAQIAVPIEEIPKEVDIQSTNILIKEQTTAQIAVPIEEIPKEVDIKSTNIPINEKATAQIAVPIEDIPKEVDIKSTNILINEQATVQIAVPIEQIPKEVDIKTSTNILVKEQATAQIVVPSEKIPKEVGIKSSNVLINEQATAHIAVPKEVDIKSTNIFINEQVTAQIAVPVEEIPNEVDVKKSTNLIKEQATAQIAVPIEEIPKEVDIKSTNVLMNEQATAQIAIEEIPKRVDAKLTNILINEHSTTRIAVPIEEISKEVDASKVEPSTDLAELEAIQEGAVSVAVKPSEVISPAEGIEEDEFIKMESTKKGDVSPEITQTEEGTVSSGSEPSEVGTVLAEPGERNDVLIKTSSTATSDIKPNEQYTGSPKKQQNETATTGETFVPSEMEQSIASDTQDLLEDSDPGISALMKLAELACRDEVNDSGLRYQPIPIKVRDNNDSSTSAIEEHVFSEVEYTNDENVLDNKSSSPESALDSKVDNEEIIKEVPSTCEMENSELLSKGELTDAIDEDTLVNLKYCKSAEAISLNVENNQRASEDQVAYKMLTNEDVNLSCQEPLLPKYINSKSTVDSEKLPFDDYICIKCKELWEDGLLKLLFEGNEPVTVQSSITYGAILCMTAYALKNKLHVENAVKSVLDSAGCGQKFGSKRVSTFCRRIQKLISSKQIKCCHRFRPVYHKRKSSSSKSSEDTTFISYEKSCSDQTNISKEEEILQSVTLSELTTKSDKSPLCNTLNSDSNLEDEISKEISEQLTWDDEPYTFCKLLGDFKCNGDYLKTGLSLPVKLYLAKERSSLPTSLQITYDSLYFNLKNFSEVDGIYNRPMSYHELIVCYVKCSNNVKDGHSTSLLYITVCTLLRVRGKVLLIPDGEALAAYIANIASEKLASRKAEDEVWDPHEVYSATISHHELNHITVRDVLSTFCRYRLDQEANNLKAPLCRHLKLLNVEDVVGFCMRLYAIYCEIAFRNKEESKARFLLNLGASSKCGGCMISADLNIFPPNGASSLDSFLNFYRNKLASKFNHASLTKENQDILLEETIKCKYDIVQFANNECVETGLLDYVEQSAQTIGTKRKICDDIDFGKPGKKIRQEKSNKRLLKEVITSVLKENIKPDTLPKIIGIIYRDIYKMEIPTLSEIQDVLTG